ncbi:hypothetical protein JCM5350_003370, partial [Sporobolomyces pararoseus]
TPQSEAQINTQHYGHRPYGVGLLVAGYDDKGPHLYEFSPSGNCLEYYAMSIGARSQSAKTYLETHYSSFPNCSLEELIKHGLNALRDTLQQDKELTVENTSIGIVGLGGQEVVESSTSSGAGETESDVVKMEQPSNTPAALGEQVEGSTKQEQEEFFKFKIIEGQDLEKYLKLMTPREETEGAAGGGGPVQERPATEIAGGDAPQQPTSGAGGEEMQTD